MINIFQIFAKTNTVSPTIVAQFNFSNAANVVSDYVNVAGSPTTVVRTGSDSRSGTAIGVSSTVANSSSTWNTFSGNAGTAAVTGSGFLLPSALFGTYWFQYSINYTAGNEQITISNLNPAKTYTVKCLGSRQGVTDNRTTTFYLVDNIGTTNSGAVESDQDVINWNGVFTGKIPTSGGVLKLGIGRDPTSNFAYLNALQIIQEN